MDKKFNYQLRTIDSAGIKKSNQYTYNKKIDADAFKNKKVQFRLIDAEAKKATQWSNITYELNVTE
jgi:hypothetical protein